MSRFEGVNGSPRRSGVPTAVVALGVCALGIGIVTLFWYRFVSAQFVSSGDLGAPPIAAVVVSFALIGGDLALGGGPSGFRGVSARLRGTVRPPRAMPWIVLALVVAGGVLAGVTVALWAKGTLVGGVTWALFGGELVGLPVVLGRRLVMRGRMLRGDLVAGGGGVVALLGVIASWRWHAKEPIAVVLGVELLILVVLVALVGLSARASNRLPDVDILRPTAVKRPGARLSRATRWPFLVRLVRTRSLGWALLAVGLAVAELACIHLALTSGSILPAVGSGVLGLFLAGEMSLGAALSDAPNPWLATLGSRFGRLRRRSVLISILATAVLLVVTGVIFSVLNVVRGSEVPVGLLLGIAVAAIGCTGVATAEAVAARRGLDAVVVALLCGTVVLMVIPVGNVLNALRQHQDPVVTAISSVTFLLIFVVGGLAYLVREPEGAST
jgi:hypothetical protein